MASGKARQQPIRFTGFKALPRSQQQAQAANPAKADRNKPATVNQAWAEHLAKAQRLHDLAEAQRLHNSLHCIVPLKRLPGFDPFGSTGKPA
jgi:hypothetical protein